MGNTEINKIYSTLGNNYLTFEHLYVNTLLQIFFGIKIWIKKTEIPIKYCEKIVKNLYT